MRWKADGKLLKHKRTHSEFKVCISTIYFMDIENREYFKNTGSLNDKVSAVRNTGLLSFIFINEYIDHP